MLSFSKDTVIHLVCITIIFIAEQYNDCFFVWMNFKTIAVVCSVPEKSKKQKSSNLHFLAFLFFAQHRVTHFTQYGCFHFIIDDDCFVSWMYINVSPFYFAAVETKIISILYSFKSSCHFSTMTYK